MTVISSMKFNDTEAAIVADEQASGRGRKNDIFQKLYEVEGVGMKSVIGGTGGGLIIHDVAGNMDVAIKENKSGLNTSRKFSDLLAYVTQNKRNELVAAEVESLFSLTQQELQSGIIKSTGLKVADPIMNEYIRFMRNVQGGNHLRNEFIMLTSENKKVDIYNIWMGDNKASPIIGQYLSVGSGSDLGGPVLSSFIKGVPRDDRDNINPIQGIVALIDATDVAATQNQGVGGTPYLKVVKEGKIYTPKVKESKLLLEIVKGTKEGIIPEKFQTKAINQLVYKSKDFDTVNAEMWSAVDGKKDQLEMFLRGYKQ